MQQSVIITGIFTAMIATASGIYTSFMARKKGPIFLNSYIWTPKDKRDAIDRNAEYRRATVVYGCISAIFTLCTIEVFTDWKWASILTYVTIAFVIWYAIVSSSKSFKKGGN